MGGETWDGTPVERAVRPGYSVCLRGEHGQGFDTSGPHVWCCPECEALVVTPGPSYSKICQDHYADAHGWVPGILPL